MKRQATTTVNIIKKYCEGGSSLDQILEYLERRSDFDLKNTSKQYLRKIYAKYSDREHGPWVRADREIGDNVG